MASFSADTLIIGAGAAGAVVASRLTENSAAQVVLLEAGPDYATLGEVPGDLRDGTRNSLLRHDWGYKHKPNAGPVVFPLPRGRVVGGSSAVNTCIALRGVPTDYAEWAELGLPEWTWEKCFPAFLALESDQDFDNEWHNQDGPMPLRRHTQEELVPWQAAFMEACAELGLPKCDDHNHPEAEGYGPHAMNKIDGVRMSAARCYLTSEVRARPNLRIAANRTVLRILFENKRTVGVEVRHGTQVEEWRAKRVVLCAGAIATPGVLLRSGIGTREQIAAIGVAQVVENKGVAQRLLDHPGAAFFLRPRPGLADESHPLIQTALRLRYAGGRHLNDLQIQAGSFAHLPNIKLNLVAMMTAIGKPHGQGKIRFTSADVDKAPVIESGFFENERDLDQGVASLQLAYECTQTKAMRDLATVVLPNEYSVRNKRLLRQWVRYMNDSGYHPCGTVPMGRQEDDWAAVDQYGQVKGVEGLLVADASIMPTVPTGNIHLPTLMIGERFGAWLRDGVLD